MKLKYLFFLAVLPFFAGCNSKKANDVGSSKGKPVITVTIEPLRYFTEAIAGNKFTVISMVPKGVSPETYDPTPQQLLDLSRSKAYFRIGYIGFEQAWMNKLMDNAPHLQVFDTSKGVGLIYDNSHVHPHDNTTDFNDSKENDEHNHLGVEPHIWTSTRNAQIIAGNILSALSTIDKENENYYLKRYQILSGQIKQTDSILSRIFSEKDTDKTFLIYHPALTYFARDYGLHQISIEAGGKEPSPAHLKELMQTCKKEKVQIIFVQPEFDRRNAELIARQTGAKVIPINPLSYDWEREMLNIGKALENKKENH